MSCPFNNNDDDEACSSGVNYAEYLKIDDLLKCQVPLSEKIGKNMVHDEYLFIIIHQTYELWFKLIIKEIESIMDMLRQPKLDERNTLLIVSRLGRIVRIQKILLEQISVLETLTPRDFDDFRKYLSTSSGFQSLQFRLIENKLGVVKAKRMRHNNSVYSEAGVFNESQKQCIKESEEEPSLVKLIDNWLCRTPGLEPDGFNFIEKIEQSVQTWFADLQEQANKEADEDIKAQLLTDLQLKRDQFSDFFDEEKHTSSKEKGDRRFSFRAMQGAFFISLYRDEPRLHQPYQILSLLMDIDSLLIKWRYNHAILVQRTIGSKHGTGGSSGYLYLLGTASDNYKVFLDLFYLSGYIIPRQYIPKLPVSMKKRLSVFSLEMTSEETGECSDSETAKHDV